MSKRKIDLEEDPVRKVARLEVKMPNSGFRDADWPVLFNTKALKGMLAGKTIEANRPFTLAYPDRLTISCVSWFPDNEEQLASIRQSIQWAEQNPGNLYLAPARVVVSSEICWCRYCTSWSIVGR
jgi:hypothetical protein